MLGVVVALIAVTLVELQMPRSTAVWVLYIPVICMTLFLDSPRAAIWTATACSAWVLLDMYWIEPPPIQSATVIRRGIGVLAFYSTAFIVRYALGARLKLRDINLAYRALARDLEIEKVKLERSNKDLERFAGMAAHDLRAPIACVMGWIDLLEESLFANPHSDEIDQALAAMRRSGRRAEDLIKDLLALSRVNITITATDRLDLNQMVGQVVEELRGQIETSGANIGLSELPDVVGNRTCIAAVFSNLLRNSLTYSDPARRPQIEIGCVQKEDRHEFFVRDNGIGIAAENYDRVFEMFGRVDSGVEDQARGTGMGLAFCKRVIELSGGQIWIVSALGTGTCVRFTYPKVPFGAGGEGGGGRPIRTFAHPQLV